MAAVPRSQDLSTQATGISEGMESNRHNRVVEALRGILDKYSIKAINQGDTDPQTYLNEALVALMREEGFDSLDVEELISDKPYGMSMNDWAATVYRAWEISQGTEPNNVIDLRELFKELRGVAELNRSLADSTPQSLRRFIERVMATQDARALGTEVIELRNQIASALTGTAEEVSDFINRLEAAETSYLDILEQADGTALNESDTPLDETGKWIDGIRAQIGYLDLDEMVARAVKRRKKSVRRRGLQRKNDTAGEQSRDTRTANDIDTRRWTYKTSEGKGVQPWRSKPGGTQTSEPSVFDFMQALQEEPLNSQQARRPRRLPRRAPYIQAHPDHSSKERMLSPDELRRQRLAEASARESEREQARQNYLAQQAQARAAAARGEGVRAARRRAAEQEAVRRDTEVQSPWTIGNTAYLCLVIEQAEGLGIDPADYLGEPRTINLSRTGDRRRFDKLLDAVADANTSKKTTAGHRSRGTKRPGGRRHPLRYSN